MKCSYMDIIFIQIRIIVSDFRVSLNSNEYSESERMENYKNIFNVFQEATGGNSLSDSTESDSEAKREVHLKL